jgi:hypothetical protein
MKMNDPSLRPSGLPHVVSAITDLKSARSANRYFRNRSILTKITRDGVTTLSMFVPKGWTPGYAMETLRLKLPAHAKLFIDGEPVEARKQELLKALRSGKLRIRLVAKKDGE